MAIEWVYCIGWIENGARVLATDKVFRTSEIAQDYINKHLSRYTFKVFPLIITENTD